MTDEIINDDIEDVIPVPEIPKVEDGQEDKTDYKALAEQQREIAEKNRGIAQRNKTRAERFKAKGLNPDGKPEEKGKPNVGKSDELDYGQLAFYNSKSDSIKIETDAEIAFLKKTIEETRKPQSSILNSKWFQSELKEMRELKQTADAVPSSSKRANQSSKDSVDYWVAKGELPPADQQELRRKVVNAKMKKDENKGMFYNS
jgi:hypothetical protein